MSSYTQLDITSKPYVAFGPGYSEAFATREEAEGTVTKNGVGAVYCCVEESGFDLYVVYDHPSDLPDAIVVRRFTLAGPTPDHWKFQAVDDAHTFLAKRGLYGLKRSPGDDPKIIEVWM